MDLRASHAVAMTQFAQQVQLSVGLLDLPQNIVTVSSISVKASGPQEKL